MKLKLFISFLVMSVMTGYGYSVMRAEEDADLPPIISSNHYELNTLTLSETGKEIETKIESIIDDLKNEHLTTEKTTLNATSTGELTEIFIKRNINKNDKYEEQSNRLLGTYEEILDMISNEFEAEKIFEENKINQSKGNNKGWAATIIEQPKSFSELESTIANDYNLQYLVVLNVDNQLIEIQYDLDVEKSLIDYESLTILLYHTDSNEKDVQQINDKILVDKLYFTATEFEDDILKTIEYTNQDLLSDVFYKKRFDEDPHILSVPMRFYLSFDDDKVDMISVHICDAYEDGKLIPMLAITEAEETMLKNMMDYANIDKLSQDKILTQFKQDIQNPTSKHSTLDNYGYNTYYVSDYEGYFKIDIIL